MFTEDPTVTTLEQTESGRHVKDVVHQPHISDVTYCAWKSTYGAWKSTYDGVKEADVQRLHDLRAEHHKLRWIAAELAEEGHTLKDAFTRKLQARRINALQPWLADHHRWSARRAYSGTDLSCPSAYCRRCPDRDADLIALLAEQARRLPERGFDKLFQLTRCRGLISNHKRARGAYWLIYLNRRRRRRGEGPIPDRPLLPPVARELLKDSWPTGFISSTPWDERCFRTFDVINVVGRAAIGVAIPRDRRTEASQVQDKSDLTTSHLRWH